MLNKRILVLMFLLIFLPLIGCFPSPAPPIAENQAPLIVSTPVTTAKVGVAYTYDIEATDPDGDTLTYSLTVKPKGMTIDSTTGIISWKPIYGQAGDNPVIVEVSDGALSDTQSFTIKVSTPPAPPVPPVVKLTSIVVLPETMSLFVGDSETIASVTAHYSNGSTKKIALGDCIYLSDDDSIAEVTTVGVVKAIAKGTAAIIVTYKGKKDKIEVTVKPALLDHIVVDPDTMTLFIREKEAFEVTAHYNNSTTKNITNNIDCIYSSSDPIIADVVSDSFSITQGWIEAVGVGEATITVSYTEGDITETDTIVVKVKAVKLTGIEVDPKSVILDTGCNPTQQLGVTAIYSDGFTLDITLETLDCIYISNDPSIASIDVNGLITAEAPGTTTIIVTYLTDWVVVVPVAVKELLVTFDSGQNLINKGNEWPYIEWQIDGLSIEFTFVNPTPFAFVFDYRVDGEAGETWELSDIAIGGTGECSGQLWGLKYNWVVLDNQPAERGIYPEPMIATVQVCAEEVWVGMRVGAENDWYLDWIIFEARW